MAPRDEFDDETSGFLYAHRRSLAIAAAVAVILLFIILVWSAYSGGDDNAAVPTIKAESESYRIRPEEPGGMDIPNQDSTVYNAMTGGDPDAGVENLLAEEDEPESVDRDALFAGLNTEQSDTAAADANTDSDADEDSATSATPAAAPPSESLPPPTEAAPADGGTEDLAEIEVSETEAENLSAAQPAPDTAPKEPRTEPGGTHYVQLASVDARGKIDAAWAEQKRKYGALLSDMDYRTQEADLGAKGMYYRIQAGPLSESGARTLCDQIKAQNPGGCLVVAK